VSKERILVVDDEESVREMVGRVIDLMGHEVMTANDGKQALEVLRGVPFTIMVTDIKMPEMDGVELMKAAKAEFPDLEIICMTGHAGTYSYTDVVGHGAADYITKPFSIDEMKAKLNRVIRERNLLGAMTQKSIELERANQELKRLDQMKSTFISSVSHELRTPLTVIKEFISLMLEGHAGSLTEDQREYLGIAKKNILRLTNLIETLLDFSRIESGKGLKLKFEPVRLTEVVEDALMTLSQQAEGKRIAIENQLDSDLPMMLIDRNRMVEVFINLVGNGIKFTPPGGKIAINSKGLTEKRDHLKLVVSDTGIGISPEDLPKVFDRFYQGQRTQEGVIIGTGLGLAITKEVIEGHQGIIQAENRPGGGASFVFTLPLFGAASIFSLLIDPMLEEAERDKMTFSIILAEFWDQRTKRETIVTDETWKAVIYALQKMVRAVDTVIPFQKNKIYILTFTHRKLAREIGERVQVKLIQGGYLPKKTSVHFKTYSYPEEIPLKEEFLKGCHQLLKED
jgi:signal transduction histidine kinase